MQSTFYSFSHIQSLGPWLTHENSIHSFTFSISLFHPACHSLLSLSWSHFPLEDHTLSQVSQQTAELLPSASDPGGAIQLKSVCERKRITQKCAQRELLSATRFHAGAVFRELGMIGVQAEPRSALQIRRSERLVRAAAACGQLTPPPLAQQLAVLLNSQSDIENFLDGTFEAVEIVVDQSCEGEEREREKEARRNINTVASHTHSACVIKQ